MSVTWTIATGDNGAECCVDSLILWWWRDSRSCLDDDHPDLGMRGGSAHSYSITLFKQNKNLTCTIYSHSIYTYSPHMPDLTHTSYTTYYPHTGHTTHTLTSVYLCGFPLYYIQAYTIILSLENGVGQLLLLCDIHTTLHVHVHGTLTPVLSWPACSVAVHTNALTSGHTSLFEWGRLWWCKSCWLEVGGTRTWRGQMSLRPGHTVDRWGWTILITTGVVI